MHRQSERSSTFKPAPKLTQTLSGSSFSFPFLLVVFSLLKHNELASHQLGGHMESKMSRTTCTTSSDNDSKSRPAMHSPLRCILNLKSKKTIYNTSNRGTLLLEGSQVASAIRPCGAVCFLSVGIKAPLHCMQPDRQATLATHSVVPCTTAGGASSPC